MEALMRMTRGGNAGGNLNAPGGNPLFAGLAGGGGGGRKKQGFSMFNNAPPVSFGLDEHGNARSVDLMEGLGGNDKEGDELMKKLSKMLGIDPESQEDGDNDAPDPDAGAGLLRGVPDMLGVQRGQGQAGNLPEASGQAQQGRG
jgi:hypothetical protein